MEWILGLIAFGLFVYFVPYKNLQNIQYLQKEGLIKPKKGEEPVVVCSFGDAAITEGEVAEAFQMAALKKLPILYLVQDNEWDISAHSSEMRAVDATHYAKGFGLKAYTIDGTDFTKSYETIQKAYKEIRREFCKNLNYFFHSDAKNEAHLSKIRENVMHFLNF